MMVSHKSVSGYCAENAPHAVFDEYLQKRPGTPLTNMV